MCDREKLAELIADYFGVDPAYYGVDAYGVANHLLSNCVTVKTWIPVSERLPENNKSVLVYCTNVTIQGGHTIHIGSCDCKKFWFLRTMPGVASFPVMEWQVTHWMPLPEVPKEGV